MKNQKVQWLKDLAQTQKGFASFLTNLPPDPQLTARFAIITNVDDPLSLGRVKLSFQNEGNNFELSEWVYVPSHPGGKLSTQFIGEKCICVFESGDPNKPIVVGFVPTPGRRAIGNPVKLPVISQENQHQPGKIPECNENNLGAEILIEEPSGTNKKICRRDDRGEYAWMASTTPQVIKTTIASPQSPEQKIGDPLGAYAPGEIFTRKTCDRDQFVSFISDYSAEGNPRFRPLVSATIYNRATTPDCNQDFLGVLAMIQTDPGNTIPCICGLKNGKYIWMTPEGREAVKFVEPFQTEEEAIAYIIDTTQNCKRQKELIKDKDKTQKETVVEVSPVPPIRSQKNLTSYLKEPAFQNQLKEQTDVRKADKGSKDRVSTMQTQMMFNAFQIADNNITQIEKYIDAKVKLELDKQIKVFNRLKGLLNLISDALFIIATALPRDSSGRGRASMRVLGSLLSPRIRPGVRNQLTNDINAYQEALSKNLRENLNQPLQPGYNFNRFDFKEINNLLETDDFNLDKTIELDDAEGTLVSTPPFNALHESAKNNLASLSRYITTLRNFPDQLQKINSNLQGVVLNSLSSSTQDIIGEIIKYKDIDVSAIALSLIPEDFNQKFSQFVDFDANGIPKIAPPDSLMTNLFSKIEIDFPLENVLYEDWDFQDIANLITEHSSLLDFSPQDITIIKQLQGVVKKSQGKLIFDKNSLISFSSALNLDLPVSLDTLDILDQNPQQLAKLALTAFCDPKNNQGNLAELIPLMQQSDQDAEGFIRMIVENVSGIKISTDKINSVVSSFREQLPAIVAKN